MGSVKDLNILEQASSHSMGRAQFVFSDRYSVFDWGEMPDLIPYKGTAIALLASYFFEKLEKQNIPTHYIGLVENNSAKKFYQLTKPSNVMEVKMVRIIKPELKGDQYDYSKYQHEKNNFLIPLEVIYRNALPPGSSVFKRLQDGQAQLEDLGLKTMPHPHQKLNKPILDVSTKLEITDRYLTWKEAKQITCMTEDEIARLKEVTLKVDQLISQEFSKIGLVNEDGKIELAFDPQRQLTVIDVLGTLDECRFTYDGIPVSKEILRIYYRNTPWNKAINEAKKKDRQNWKAICTLKPEPLPKRLLQLISYVYCGCTNEVTQKTWFADVPPLKETLQEVKEIIGE